MFDALNHKNTSCTGNLPALSSPLSPTICRELEHDALYQEVSALLALADACMHRVPASQASAQLLREGFKCPMSMYKAAKRDLQVGSCRQALTPNMWFV